MPDHLVALVAILIIASTVFAVARTPACAMACDAGDFKRRRNLWFGLVVLAFLAHNFWLFIVLAGVLLFVAQRKEHNALALFFLLMFALPRIADNVPGFGGIQSLVTIDIVRLLALTILLPAYLRLRKQPGVAPFGHYLTDKFLIGYLALCLLLLLDQKTLPAALREGVFDAFTDEFLPYYLASRAVRNLQDFRDALMSFAVAALIVASILIVEFITNWLMFASLDEALGVRYGWLDYLARGGNLRAAGPIGYPIVAGYVVAVAAGFFLYLAKVVPGARSWGIGMALLVAGMLATLSRGPWVGFAVMLLVFIATGPAPARAATKMALYGLLAAPVLLATPVGDKIIDYLPWVGTVEASTVDAREILLRATIDLLMENPLFGSIDYAEHPLMQVLADGNGGFIDLTNTYAVVGIGKGMVGLFLFVGSLLAAAAGALRGMRMLQDKSDERHVLGRSLLATFTGILVIIGTVSPILTVPFVYLTAAGLCVAYAKMLATDGQTTEGKAAAPLSGAGRAGAGLVPRGR